MLLVFFLLWGEWGSVGYVTANDNPINKKQINGTSIYLRQCWQPNRGIYSI